MPAPVVVHAFPRCLAMTAEPSFDDLMARLRAGDQAAASQLFHRFACRLIGLARGRLDALVRQKVDPEDVVQSVFKSFFLRHASGQWDLGGWDGLWALLTVLTVRKCGRHAVHYRAGRRDVRREASPQGGKRSRWPAAPPWPASLPRRKPPNWPTPWRKCWPRWISASATSWC